MLALSISDHRKLVATVNSDWCHPLGFSLKMRRPPKTNKDGSQTLRLYCSLAKGSLTNGASTSEVIEIEESAGIPNDEVCFFGLTFKLVFESQTWILYDQYQSSS